jgi:hypothetical protein
MSTDPAAREPHPDPQKLTKNTVPRQNSSPDVDYEPHPENSLPVSETRKKILKSICNLYSGSASEDDMQIYAEKAIYVSHVTALGQLGSGRSSGVKFRGSWDARVG